jgi:hypothetical protein
MKGSNSSQTIQAFGCAPLTNRKLFCRTFAATTGKKGNSGMKREAVLENVRRYRAIASLHRQAAAAGRGMGTSRIGGARSLLQQLRQPDLRPTMGSTGENCRVWRACLRLVAHESLRNR